MKRIIDVCIQSHHNDEHMEKLVNNGDVLFDTNGGMNGGQILSPVTDNKDFAWYDGGNESLGQLLQIDWDHFRQDREVLLKVLHSITRLGTNEHYAALNYLENMTTEEVESIDHIVSLTERIQNIEIEDFKVDETIILGKKEDNEKA